MTVAITGATGLIGSRLASKLTSQGNKVIALTRDPSSAQSKLPYQGVEFVGPADWAKAIAGADGVVNLAGEPIATRWSSKLKVAIRSSRVDTTRKLVDAINSLPAGSRPKVLVSSSAIGFYGSSETAAFDEASPRGGDFLSRVCEDWEAATTGAPADVRTVVLRTGIVLAREGGALGKMVPVFQLFAGGPLGTGRQWMSWVHRDDMVDLIIESLRNPSYRGTYNATAPKPVRMADFCTALGNAMGRPSWAPVPDFALNLILGEGASVVLEGQQVLPKRTQEAGFQFRFPDVDGALRDILKA